jgi:hypothetical protein
MKSITDEVQAAEQVIVNCSPPVKALDETAYHSHTVLSAPPQAYSECTVSPALPVSAMETLYAPELAPARKTITSLVSDVVTVTTQPVETLHDVCV